MSTKTNPVPATSSVRGVVIPSKLVFPTSGTVEAGTQIEGFEEVEIAAQVTLPIDGGWAWMVLACATTGHAIVDGIAFTFGPILPEVCKELRIPESMGTLFSSTALGVYFFMSPLASALINRFNFRTIGMVGSMMMCCGLFGSYLSKNFFTMIVLYGVVNGLGLSFASLVVSMVCGFYFEKFRRLALTTVSTGTSIGTMILYPVNVAFVENCGWRTLILFHSGISGLVYFLSLSFKPLVVLTLTNVEDDLHTTRTVTYLPTISSANVFTSTNKICATSVPERILKTVSSVYFPTAAQVVQTASPKETDTTTTDVTSTSTAKSKINIKASSAITPGQFKRIQSIISTRQSMQGSVIFQGTVKPAKKKCCARIFDWEPSQPEARPLYRDDAFYTGNIEDLPAYKDNVLTVPEKNRTGLEYQMAVTRAATVTDLRQRRGVFTTAIRRILVSMIDPGLLSKKSFMMFCSSGFLASCGVLIPYVYTQARALHYGIDGDKASMLVSVLAFSNMIGRAVSGILVMKINSVTVLGVSMLIAGLSTMLSGLSYNTSFQFAYVLLFGFTIAPYSCLRSIVIVDCYGLDNLTNATGLARMFIGVANMIGTPSMAALKTKYGFEYAFYCSGGFIASAGIMCLLPMKFQLRREQKKK